jgi:hypothetical protein
MSQTKALLSSVDTAGRSPSGLKAKPRPLKPFGCFSVRATGNVAGSPPDRVSASATPPWDSPSDGVPDRAPLADEGDLADDTDSYDRSGALLNSDYSPTNQITATLSTPATAVGLGYGSLSAGGATFAFLLSTGDSFTLSTGGSIESGSLGFAGFTSTTPITSIQFTMPDAPGYNAIDNFQTATAVPEPGHARSALGGSAGPGSKGPARKAGSNSRTLTARQIRQ